MKKKKTKKLLTKSNLALAIATGALVVSLFVLVLTIYFWGVYLNGAN